MFRHTLFPTSSAASAEFDKFLDTIIGTPANSYPAVDIYTDNKCTYIEVAVTGFNQSELSAYLDDDKLFIEGKKERKDSDVDDMYQREYSSRKIAKRDFKLQYKLLKKVQDIEATLEFGILKLKLLQDTEASTRKAITIS